MRTKSKSYGKRILAVKIILTVLLAGVALYCLYAFTGQFAIWFQQPRFVRLSDGATAASAGFLIQSIVFGVLFLLTAAATVFMGLKFYKKPQKSRRQTIEHEEEKGSGK